MVLTLNAENGLKNSGSRLLKALLEDVSVVATGDALVTSAHLVR
jgi:hypothetical protein